jgi:hypothetical protein
MHTSIRFLALAIAACAHVAPVAAQQYSCVVFPWYGGFKVSPAKLNNLAESVGSVHPGGGTEIAAIFRADGTIKYVHDAPSLGVDINDSGNAVFTLHDYNRTLGIAYYDAASNTARTVYTPADPSLQVAAAGIDAANTVYGVLRTNSGGRSPFKIVNGNFVDLTPVLGAADIGGVSRNGDITGGRFVSGIEHAYRYRSGARRPVDLHNLVGGGLSSSGLAINSSATVGGSRNVGGASIGFVVVGRTVHDVAPGVSNQVRAVNEAGDAVAAVGAAGGRFSPFIGARACSPT